MIDYTNFMLEKYGQEVIDLLTLQASSTRKYSDFDLELLADDFKKKRLSLPNSYLFR